MKALLVLVALAAAAQARSAQHRAQPFASQQDTQDALGSAKASGAPRIVNGGQASRGQFPYHVALFLDGSGSCDGSLISQRWVLTAGHCAHGITRFSLYIGASNLAANEAGRVVISTTSKIVHSGYNPATLNNNVALVNLGQAIALSTYIQSIPLATGSSTYAGQTARLTGWRLNSGSSQVGNALQYANLTVITNSVCTTTYGSTTIISSTLCAKFADGVASCGASEGSPLVHIESGAQIGVASFTSPRGCTEGAPVAFSRVTSYASWISANTGIGL